MSAAFAACPDLLDTPSDLIIGIGGTCRACKLLADDLYPETPLTVHLVKKLLKDLLNEDPATVASMKRVITPGRWAVLAPGLNMLGAVMDAYHAENLRVSEGCVREGYLLKHI